MRTNEEHMDTPELPTRLHVATDWWLRLREPNVPPAVIAEWMKWCDEDPQNKEAFASVQDLWQKTAAAPLRPAYLLPRKAGEGKGGGNRRFQRWHFATAATLASAAIISPLYLTNFSPNRIRNGIEVTTAIATNRKLTLPDGSQATLGAASGLRTDYTEDRRTIRLTHGEAFFKVKPERNHPFVVETPSMSVIAIGTAFNVRTDGSTLRVTVSEGVVELKSSTDSVQPIRLRAGQQAAVTSAAAEPEVTDTNPNIAIAWTTGTLKFMEEPLSAVIDTVNRYSTAPISVQQPQLSGLRYTGTVVSGRIGEWLQALPDSFPVEVVHQETGRILIRPREIVSQ